MRSLGLVLASITATYMLIHPRLKRDVIVEVVIGVSWVCAQDDRPLTINDKTSSWLIILIAHNKNKFIRRNKTGDRERKIAAAAASSNNLAANWQPLPLWWVAPKWTHWWLENSPTDVQVSHGELILDERGTNSEAQSGCSTHSVQSRVRIMQLDCTFHPIPQASFEQVTSWNVSHANFAWCNSWFRLSRFNEVRPAIRPLEGDDISYTSRRRSFSIPKACIFGSTARDFRMFH